MTFLASITTEAMRRRLEHLIETDSEVRAISYMLGADRMLEWLHSVGPSRDEALRSTLPAIPPTELRVIVADRDEPVFLWTGGADVSYLLDLLEQLAPPTLQTPRRILDFGCGCGRLARYLALSQRYDAIGSDVNAEQIAWCSDNLPTATFVHHGTLPPLPLPDRSLDFVYSLSVFSHLPEHAATAWLQELARLIVPGGLLAITTHGPTALNHIRGSEPHYHLFKMDDETVDRTLERLQTERLIFRPFDYDGEYGQTFINPEQASSLWSDVFETVHWQAAGLRGWQDTYVLRRT